MIDKAWRPTAKTWEKINEMAPTVMSMSFPEFPSYRPKLSDTMEARINGETWLEFRERIAAIERHHREGVLKRCLEEEE